MNRQNERKKGKSKWAKVATDKSRSCEEFDQWHNKLNSKALSRVLA